MLQRLIIPVLSLFYFLFTYHPTFALSPTPATDSGDLTATPTATIAPTPIPPPPPDTGVNFTVSPSTLLIDIAPGTTKQFPLKIRNNNPQPEALTLSTKKVVPKNGGGITFADFEPEDQLPHWLQFDQNQIIVEPYAWGEVTLTFSPPANAMLGYYFAVLFNRAQEPDTPENLSQVVGAPAIIALTQVTSDQARPELQLINFSVSRRWYDFLPVKFSLTLENTGNIHLKPFGNIFVDQGNQRDLATLNFNEASGYILPGMTRTFDITWSDGFPLRVYEADGSNKSKITWNLDNLQHFRLGQYSATALTAYDDGQRDIPLEQSLEFWIIPWQILLALTLVALLILAGLLALLKPLLRPIFRRK